MHTTRSFPVPSGSWRRTLVAVLHLLLLAPVPAFAYTIGSWTQVAGIPGDNWLASPQSGLTLNLTPVADSITNFGGSGTVTQTFVFSAPVTGSGTGTASTANWQNLQVSASSGSGLQVIIGFDTSSNPSGNPANLIYQSNQFNTGTLPSNLPGTYNPKATSTFAVVELIFKAGPGSTTTWGPASVSSSPVSITFQ
jgi:hypothetical protein